MGPSPTSMAATRKRRRAENSQNRLDEDSRYGYDIDKGGDDEDDEDSEVAGIIPRAFQSLFNALEEKKIKTTESTTSTTLLDYQVSIQFLELYGEEIRDLLTGHNRDKKLTIRDLGTDEPEVVGATQQIVTSAEEAFLCLSHGMLRRVTGATAMNESSSRSHAILSILVEQQQSMILPSASEEKCVDNDHVQATHSRFNFVDLAGSERQKRTQSTGKRLQEGIDINKGLLVLGNVISALGDPKKRGKTFVPYRDSKLTRLLKGSLGGNHKTLMIACVSPASSNMEESLNCLRYANRARNIQNHAIVNVDGNSRLLQELQTHVQVLATDLIRILNVPCDGQQQPFVATSYPRHVLESMASGGKLTAPPGTLAPALLGAPLPTFGGLQPVADGSILPRVVSLVPSSCQQQQNDSDRDRKLMEMEIELSKVQDLLRQSRSNHDSAEEQLYIVKAQKELSDLQLSVLQESNPNFSMNEEIIQQAYLQKSLSYEKEIGQLKTMLQEAEMKMQRMKWASSVDSSSKVKDEDDEQFLVIKQAEIQLAQDRHLLSNLKSSLSIAEGNDVDSESYDMKTRLDRIDDEQFHEEAELQHLTTKYLRRSDDDDDFDYADHQSMLSITTAPEKTNRGSGLLPPTPSTSQRERKVQADLAELSRSIAAKENLIDQLKLSQEKYASMREFYEERLRQMELVLKEKEQERENLLRHLRHLKEEGHAGSAEIEEKLGQKEKHIADLRKKQQDLMKLTAVSSRNDLEISRLHDEVQHMKRLKVDLQKRLAEERKAHAKQMKELQKAALIKEKELTKIKKISNQRGAEAERANQVAKQRLDELSQLRSKYKDVEKKARMASLKRGVLAKAGIDPVIIGRREGGPSQQQNTKRQGVSGRGGDSVQSSAVNADLLRTYFDQKVAGVVRKESIVDKLAREWEEHFELSNRKQELLSQDNIDNPEETEEENQALSIQIQFKEERIRKLASRLNTSDELAVDKMKINSSTKSDTFLFDKDFSRICKGLKPERAHVAAARVLFGMIVRERRRVAALAKTASSLDDRVQAAERAAELSAEALRSYMVDQRDELATLTQNQQEHILSLMDIVKEDSLRPLGPTKFADHFDAGHSEELFQRKLLVLANERVELLEKQTAELQMEAAEHDSYRKQLEEMKDSLTAKLLDYEDVQNELLELRSALQSIRDLLGNTSSDESVGNEQNGLRSLVLDIVMGGLYPTTPEDSSGHEKTAPCGKKAVRKPLRSTFLSARGNRKFEALLDDSEGESGVADNTPEWANDIMSDLALIAEGKLPPSMENAPAIREEVSHFEKSQNKILGESKTSSVFDRLSDPKKFTGTQKQVLKNTKSASAVYRPSPAINAERRREERKAMSKEISNRLDNIIVPQVAATRSDDDIEAVGNHSSDLSDQNKAYQSVFDRLMSPSQYTGTQKEKFQETKQKRERTTEPDADKLLDELLQPNECSSKEMDPALGHQSVFDRLVSPSQYTGTQKEKFLEAKQKRDRAADQIADRVLDGILQLKESNSKAGDHAVGHSDQNLSHPRGHISLYTEYASQNVFERLQKTTTQAFAIKTHHNLEKSSDVPPSHLHVDSSTRLHYQDGSAPSATTNFDYGNRPASGGGGLSQRQDSSPLLEASSSSQSDRHVHSDYIRQDVFERLQKTTTEAYAKKTNPRFYHHDTT